MKDGNGAVIGTSTTSDATAGTISVYLAGTTTAATVYTASSGGSSVGSVSTDANGYFYFWVDDTEYASSQLFKITLSHADFETKEYDNLIIIPHSMTHLASDGSDHTFIDQSVISGATPTFTGTNFTGIPMAGILSADKTGSDADLVTGTKGDANDFAMWNADGDLVGGSVAESEFDYARITGNDGATDVTAAELEELSDGSDTVLHVHNWTYGSQTATTSGTTVVLTTAITSGAIEIEIMLSGVSVDAAEDIIIQLGDAGGYETSGYVSTAAYDTDTGEGGAGSDETSTAGFIITTNNGAATTNDGVIRLIRWDTSEHLWMATGIINGVKLIYSAGTKTTSGALTSIRLNTASGTDNFDAGEARIRFK
jgi:hypothetical protein